jgi:RimJ/RimL family protein N-acetyltransferase
MTHAVGLLMKRVLDSVDEGGLGLRRCQWKCHSMNEKSKASAVRLGYVPEGTIRAWVVVPQGRPSIHGE